MVESWQPPLDGRGDGAEQQDQRQVQVPHHRPAQHPRVLVSAAYVQRDGVQDPEGEVTGQQVRSQARGQQGGSQARLQARSQGRDQQVRPQKRGQQVRSQRMGHRGGHRRGVSR